MTIKAKRFSRSIVLKATDVDVEGIEGELKVGLTSKELHAFLDGALRTVLTADQEQTLTNKTIVVADNTITTAPSGNLEADELNAALAELQGDIDVLNANKTAGPVTSTDNAIARFNGETGKVVQNSGIQITDSNVITPTAASAKLVLDGSGLNPVELSASGIGVKSNGFSVSTITIPAGSVPASGANVKLQINPSKHIRVNNSAITSIDMIEPLVGGIASIQPGQEITLINVTGQKLTLNNRSGEVTNLQIHTGTGGKLDLADGDALNLVYNAFESCWQVIGSAFKGPASATDNTLPRFDGTDGQRLQTSGVLVSDADEVSGIKKLDVDDITIDGDVISSSSESLKLNSDIEITGTLDVSGEVSTGKATIDGDLVVTGLQFATVTTDAVSTGTSATIVPQSKIHRLTNPGLKGILAIAVSSPVDGEELVLINHTGDVVVILNDKVTSGIVTGTGRDLKLAPGGSLSLVHEINTSRWNVIGGVGGGASTIDAISGEALAAGDCVYISTGTGNDSERIAGCAYKVDPTNDDRIEVVGFVVDGVTGAGAPVEVQVNGLLDDAFTDLTPGAMYFADASVPGGISTTPPSDNGQWAISVGVATTAEQLAINPCASASANYIQDTDRHFNVLNNRAAPLDVTDLYFDPILYKAVVLEYVINRSTSTTSLSQVGQLRAVYNSGTSSWSFSETYAGENAGITFSIQPSGQVQYISTNLSGTGYQGSLTYNIIKTFEA